KPPGCGRSTGVYSGPDAAGYYTPARMIAAQGTMVLRPESSAQFIGYHWLDGGDGSFHVRYPPGLPTLLAPAYRIGGPAGVRALNAVLALAGVVILFLIARRWVPEPLALAGAVASATLPVLNEQALLGFSHVATGTIFLGALLAADIWRERPRALTALAGGFLLGVLPTIRYPAILLALGVGLYQLGGARTPAHRRSIGLVALGAALPIGALLIHHWIVHGSVLETGYALSGEDRAFGLAYFRRNLFGYIGTLGRNGGAIVLFGTIGMLAMLRRSETRARGILTLGLAASASALYASYYWPGTDIRFLLPVLPLWILGAVALLDEPESRRWRRYFLLGFLTLHLLVAIPDGLRRMTRLSDQANRAAIALAGVRASVPAGSVVIGPHAVQTQLEPYGEWKLAEWTLLWVGPLPDPGSRAPQSFDVRGRRQHSPFQVGKADSLRARYRGLEPEARLEAVLDDLFLWAEGRGVYWIADEAWIGAVEPLLTDVARLEPLGRIPPTPSGPDARIPGAGGGFWLPDLPLDVYEVHQVGARQIAVMAHGSSKNVQSGKTRE
ncbi:MAG: hypothetical protein OEU54_11425, partial [Gemmatimonadota bacterium]|nr:hypothetical protein [Gemmatimonadota bacterium]